MGFLTHEEYVLVFNKYIIPVWEFEVNSTQGDVAVVVVFVPISSPIG